MPPQTQDPLGQFVQNIPPDQLDHIHEALFSIRSGMQGGKPLDTSGVDQEKLGRLWDAVHGRVAARNQSQAEADIPTPSLGERASALGAKFVDATTNAETALGRAGRYAMAHPIQTLMSPQTAMIASNATNLPTVDISKLETPGYAQEHPIMHGAAQGASGLTSPGMLASAGMAEAETMLPKAAPWIRRAFTATLAKGNYDQARAAWDAYKRGDITTVKQMLGQFATTAPLTALGAAGELPERPKASGSTQPPIVQPSAPQVAKTPTPEPAAVAKEVYRRAMAPNETTSRATPTSELAGKLWEGLDQGTQAMTPQLHADMERIAGGRLTPVEAETLNRKLIEERLQPGKADETTAIREERRSQLEKPDPNRYAGPERRAEPPVDTTAKVVEITQALAAGARGTKTPEEKVAWAAQRSDLMAEKARLESKPEEKEGPLQQIQRAVLRAVTPDSNPRSPNRSVREADLGKLVDQHAASGAIDAEDLHNQADAAENRAKAIQYHLDVQGAKAELQAARREAGVQRIRVSQYAEPGEEVSDTEAGERPAGAKMQFVDQASTARRTVLDMLGGYNLTAKRLYDAETGRVERNFKTQPLTEEESKFAREHQAALSQAVKEAQAAKAMPDEARLAEMEGHVTAIEAATGMKMVYSGKGSSLEGFDPSMSALNELIGRGAKSKLSKPLERAPIVRDRLNDAAQLFRAHAQRLEEPGAEPAGLASFKDAAEKLGIEYRGVQEGIPGKIADVHIFQDPKSGTSIGVEADKWSEGELGRRLDAARLRMGTPAETPTTTPAVPEPAAELDHATQLRPILLDRAEAIQERMEGSNWDQVPAEQKQLLERARGWLEKAAEDPEAYKRLPGSMRTEIEKAARNGEAGIIRTGLLVPGFVEKGVNNLRDWATNVEDTTKLPGAVADRLENFKLRMAEMRVSLGKIKNKYLGFTGQTDAFAELLHTIQGDRIMEQAAQRKLDKAQYATVPDKIDRNAINHLMEYQGKPEALDAAIGRAKNDPRIIRGLERAKELSPEARTVADNLIDQMRTEGEMAVKERVLSHLIDNYSHHLGYKDKPVVDGRPDGIQTLKTDVAMGKWRDTPSAALSRVFETIADARAAGKLPKSMDGLLAASKWRMEIREALRTRAFFKAGQDILDSEGRPLFHMSGARHIIEAAGEDPVMLIRSQVKPQANVGTYEDPQMVYTGDYMPISHRLAAGYQYWGTDPISGQKVLYEGQLGVNPRYAAQIKSMLEPSAFQGPGVVKGALRTLKAITQTAKQAVIYGTGFHAVNITARGAFDYGRLGVLDKVDPEHNPDQLRLLYNGLTAGSGYRPEDIYNQPSGKIAGTAYKGLTWMHHWLFDGMGSYTTQLKMDIGVRAMQRLDEAKPEWSANKRAQVAAFAMNDEFGGLNNESLGTSKTMQDWMQLVSFAPDFTRGTLRTFTQAAKPEGVIQRRAILQGGLTLFAAYRVLNAALNKGDTKAESNPFSVSYDGKEYRLRTRFTDIYNLWHDPRQYLAGRENLASRGAVELVTGRDTQGYEVTGPDMLRNAVKDVAPSTVQGWLKDKNDPWLNAAFRGIGISTSDTMTDAEQLALTYRRQAIPRGPKASEEKAHLQALSGIRRLSREGKLDEMGEAIQREMQTGNLTIDDAKKLMLNTGKAYLPQLMHGLSASQSFDVYRKATPEERDEIRLPVYRSYLHEMTKSSVLPAAKARAEKEAEELFK